MRHRVELLAVAAVSLLLIYAAGSSSPFYDYTGESPGTVHKITVSDLASPSAEHVGVASPEPQPRPSGAMPKTLPGFKVNVYASDLTNPRPVRARLFVRNGDSGGSFSANPVRGSAPWRRRESPC